MLLWITRFAVIVASGQLDIVFAETDLREPPPIYQQKLAPLLTSLEEILSSAAAFKSKGEDGVTLLNEEIHYIDETGRRYLVIHRALKALNETGAKDIAERLTNYRKANQQIFLVEAQTILADGTRIPIRPDAAIHPKNPAASGGLRALR